MVNIVIIGLGSGGFAASLSIRRTDPDAFITIIEKRSYDMFSPCGMPYAIEVWCVWRTHVLAAGR